MTEGLLVFVGGNVDVDIETFNDDNENETNKVFSNEAQIAKL